METQGSVVEHLFRLVAGHRDLAEILPDTAFATRLSEPSNTIGAQFWCVVGARESYARAIARNGWAGFSCSLPGDSTGDRASVIRALDDAAATLRGSLESVEWTSTREQSLLDLLEHEAQHQGQLIRYVYGLGYRFPESWLERWALSQ